VFFLGERKAAKRSGHHEGIRSTEKEMKDENLYK
jgi:hypothetical protein